MRRNRLFKMQWKLRPEGPKQLHKYQPGPKHFLIWYNLGQAETVSYKCCVLYGDSLCCSFSSDLWVLWFRLHTVERQQAQLLCETGVSYECEARIEQGRSENWHETEVMGCQIWEYCYCSVLC